MRRLRTVAIVVATAGLAAACGAEPAAVAPAADVRHPALHATVLPLGTVAQVGDPVLGTGTVTVTSVAVHTRPARPDQPAPSRGTYVVFRVTMTATGGPLLATPFALAAYVPDGPSVECDEGSAPSSGWGTPRFATTRLAAGQSVTGEVVFDLADPHGTLVYDQGGPTERAWAY